MSNEPKSTDGSSEKSVDDVAFLRMLGVEFQLDNRTYEQERTWAIADKLEALSAPGGQKGEL